MSNRITKIYTKTGDKGETGLSRGKRVRKNCPEIQAIGDVDELNSVLGMLLAYDIPDDLRTVFLKIQHQLFDLGAQLNCADYDLISEGMIEQLEVCIDQYNEDLPPLKNFILPGGSIASSTCHLARAVCRRAERSVVALGQNLELDQNIQIYLNRLSDFLFVASRVLSRYADKNETLWDSNR